MVFKHHSFVKIVDKSTGQIVKDFEDELLTDYYMRSDVAKTFHIDKDNDNVVEIEWLQAVRLIVFTSYPSIVVCRSFYESEMMVDADSVQEVKCTSNDHGIVVFDDILPCDRIILIFYYRVSPKETLMTTKPMLNEHNATIKIYKNSVHYKFIKMVPFNPGWKFTSQNNFSPS